MKFLLSGCLVRVKLPRSRNPHPQVACPKTCSLQILNLVREQRYAYTLIFIVNINIDVIVAESTGVAQVEDPMASIGAEDSAVQTSTGEPGAVEFIVAPVAVEATTITIPEVLAMISCRKSLLLALSLHKLSWLPSPWTLAAPS